VLPLRAKTTLTATLLAAGALAPMAGGGPGPGGASGAITYRGKSAAIRHAAMVQGLDAVDGKKTLRRLVLTAADSAPAIERCATMACVDAAVTEGMEVDFDAGPRLNYWIALDGQRIQYSGTAVPESFAATSSDRRRMAGRLAIDDSSAGGPAIDVELDAPLVRTFSR